MKSAELHLPYFKQGEDLEYALEHSENVPEALESHANQLRFAADTLTTLADALRGQAVRISAHDYKIVITAAAGLIDDLIEREILDPCLELEVEEYGQERG